MRKGSSESTTTVMPTEYGPLVLARTVIFGSDDDDAAPLRRRDAASSRDGVRPHERT